jgi:tellurite resistance protein TehA-like permease
MNNRRCNDLIWFSVGMLKSKSIKIEIVNRLKKTENHKKSILLDIFGCSFVKTAGSDFHNILSYLFVKINSFWIYLDVLLTKKIRIL